MKLIFVTSENCPSCAVQKEVLRRLLPKFPDIEVVSLDSQTDAEEIEKLKVRSVPTLILDGRYLYGTHTLRETEAFLRGE